MVQIALLDPDQKREGPRRGCDTVVMVTRAAAPAEGPAERALRTLFALDRTRVDGLYNFIDRTRDTLRLERVEVDRELARVFLSGHVSGIAGVCDHPRARIQIIETVQRAVDVRDVVIFLNGERSDLQPDMRGVSR